MLMAALYRAFRNRRSLLLLNLEQPGAAGRAAVGQRARPATAPPTTRPVTPPATRCGRLGELALDAFPGTLLPNPFVR